MVTISVESSDKHDHSTRTIEASLSQVLHRTIANVPLRTFSKHEDRGDSKHGA